MPSLQERLTRYCVAKTNLPLFEICQLEQVEEELLPSLEYSSRQTMDPAEKSERFSHREISVESLFLRHVPVSEETVSA